MGGEQGRAPVWKWRVCRWLRGFLQQKQGHRPRRTASTRLKACTGGELTVTLPVTVLLSTQVGVLAYELLVGRPPFEAAEREGVEDCIRNQVRWRLAATGPIRCFVVVFNGAWHSHAAWCPPPLASHPHQLPLPSTPSPSAVAALPLRPVGAGARIHRHGAQQGPRREADRGGHAAAPFHPGSLARGRAGGGGRHGGAAAAG